MWHIERFRRIDKFPRRVRLQCLEALEIFASIGRFHTMDLLSVKRVYAICCAAEAVRFLYAKTWKGRRRVARRCVRSGCWMQFTLWK